MAYEFTEQERLDIQAAFDSAEEGMIPWCEKKGTDLFISSSQKINLSPFYSLKHSFGDFFIGESDI